MPLPPSRPGRRMVSGNLEPEPTMKLNDLRNAAAKADQELHIAKRRAKDLQAKAKAGKAALQQARLNHKRARKAAKQTKSLALAAKEQARDRLRIWEKAQKRLAKALKKLAKAHDAKKPSQTPAGPRKASGPGSKGKRQARSPRAPEKRPLAGQATPVGPGPGAASPPSPAV
jgi:hypothetical protein